MSSLFLLKFSNFDNIEVVLHQVSFPGISDGYAMFQGFPGGASGKEPACSNAGSIHALGRSPGGEHGNPLQYSCLANPHEQKSLAGYSL